MLKQSNAINKLITMYSTYNDLHCVSVYIISDKVDIKQIVKDLYFELMKVENTNIDDSTLHPDFFLEENISDFNEMSFEEIVEALFDMEINVLIAEKTFFV